MANDFFDFLLGSQEPAISMATGMAAEPIAGLTGLVTANPDNVQKVRDAMTYQPRTETGQRTMGAGWDFLSRMFDNPYIQSALNNFERSADYLGERSPAAGAALKTLPAIAGMGTVPKFRGAGNAVARDIGSSMANPEFKIGRNAHGGYISVNAEDLKDLYAKRNPSDVVTQTESQWREALKGDKTGQRIMDKGNTVSDGQTVGVRLNVNLSKKGINLNSIHEGSAGGKHTQGKPLAAGEVLTYQPVTTVKNAYFNVDQKIREKIAQGTSPKAPMADVDGEFTKNNSFDGVEFKFNPKREHLFRDARGRALKYADEATVHGNKVYARGRLEYFDEGDIPARTGNSPTEAVPYK